jgi:hypothetical protein
MSKTTKPTAAQKAAKKKLPPKRSKATDKASGKKAKAKAQTATRGSQHGRMFPWMREHFTKPATREQMLKRLSEAFGDLDEAKLKARLERFLHGVRNRINEVLGAYEIVEQGEKLYIQLRTEKAKAKKTAPKRTPKQKAAKAA